MESTNPSPCCLLDNPWARMPTVGMPAVMSTIHPVSSQRMDCVVYRRIFCIALILFRKGPERHIQMTRLSLTYLARSLSSIMIKYSHHVIFLICIESRFVQARAHYLQMHGFRNCRRFLSHLDRSIAITIDVVPFIVVAAQGQIKNCRLSVQGPRKKGKNQMGTAEL